MTNSRFGFGIFLSLFFILLNLKVGFFTKPYNWDIELYEVCISNGPSMSFVLSTRLTIQIPDLNLMLKVLD